MRTVATIAAECEDAAAAARDRDLRGGTAEDCALVRRWAELVAELQAALYPKGVRATSCRFGGYGHLGSDCCIHCGIDLGVFP
jgi:hypothetical protein